jgi:hypothetical protein
VEHAYARPGTVPAGGDRPSLPSAVGLRVLHHAGGFQQARVLAEEMLTRRASTIRPPPGALCAGNTMFAGRVGRPAHTEQSIALYDPQQHARWPPSWHPTPGTLPRLFPAGFLAIGPGPAVTQDALALAQELAHPFSPALPSPQPGCTSPAGSRYAGAGRSTLALAGPRIHSIGGAILRGRALSRAGAGRGGRADA